MKIGHDTDSNKSAVEGMHLTITALKLTTEAVAISFFKPARFYR